MKNVNMNFRVSKELREEFYKVAEDNTHNPSALLRKWIKDYIKENKKV